MAIVIPTLCAVLAVIVVIFICTPLRNVIYWMREST